jgi:hypothetical protein
MRPLAIASATPDHGADAHGIASLPQYLLCHVDVARTEWGADAELRERGYIPFLATGASIRAPLRVVAGDRRRPCLLFTLGLPRQLCT